MSEKYAGLIGRFHLWKEGLKEKWGSVKEAGGLEDSLKAKTSELKEEIITKMNHGDEEYDHLYRRVYPHHRMFSQVLFWLLFQEEVPLGAHPRVCSRDGHRILLRGRNRIRVSNPSENW